MVNGGGIIFTILLERRGAGVRRIGSRPLGKVLGTLAHLSPHVDYYESVTFLP